MDNHPFSSSNEERSTPESIADDIGAASIAFLPGTPGAVAATKWDESRRAIRAVDKAGFVYFQAPSKTTDASTCKFDKKHSAEQFVKELGILQAFFESTADGGVKAGFGKGFQPHKDSSGDDRFQWAAGPDTKGNYDLPEKCDAVCSRQEDSESFVSCRSLMVGTDLYGNTYPTIAKLRTCDFDADPNVNLYSNVETIFTFDVNTDFEKETFYDMFSLYAPGEHWSDGCEQAENGAADIKDVFVNPSACDAAEIRLKAPPSGEGEPTVTATLKDCTTGGILDGCRSGKCFDYSQERLIFDDNNWDVPQLVDFRYVSEGSQTICMEFSGGGYDGIVEHFEAHACAQSIPGLMCCEPGAIPDINNKRCIKLDPPPVPVTPIEKCAADQKPSGSSHPATDPWFRGDLLPLPGQTPGSGGGAGSRVVTGAICALLVLAIGGFAYQKKSQQDQQAGQARSGANLDVELRTAEA